MKSKEHTTHKSTVLLATSLWIHRPQNTIVKQVTCPQQQSLQPNHRLSCPPGTSRRNRRRTRVATDLTYLSVDVTNLKIKLAEYQSPTLIACPGVEQVLPLLIPVLITRKRTINKQLRSSRLVDRDLSLQGLRRGLSSHSNLLSKHQQI